MKVILWFTILTCLMPITAIEAQSKTDEQYIMHELDMMYKCGDSKISDMLKSNLTIFDSLEGVSHYIETRLPEWALFIIASSAETAIKKHLNGEITIESIHDARDYFIDRLRLALIDKAKKDGVEVGDCQMEIADIMDSLSRNKIYNLYNRNFHRTFLLNNIPLRFRSAENHIEVLMISFIPQLKMGNGVCKTYLQKGARNTLKLTICN